MGSSLAVQWLGLCASTARGLGLFPGRGNKLPQAMQHDQNNNNNNNYYLLLLLLWVTIKLSLQSLLLLLKM